MATSSVAVPAPASATPTESPGKERTAVNATSSASSEPKQIPTLAAMRWGAPFPASPEYVPITPSQASWNGTPKLPPQSKEMMSPIPLLTSRTLSKPTAASKPVEPQTTAAAAPDSKMATPAANAQTVVPEPSAVVATETEGTPTAADKKPLIAATATEPTDPITSAASDAELDAEYVTDMSGSGMSTVATPAIVSPLTPLTPQEQPPPTTSKSDGEIVAQSKPWPAEEAHKMTPPQLPGDTTPTTSAKQLKSPTLADLIIAKLEQSAPKSAQITTPKGTLDDVPRVTVNKAKAVHGVIHPTKPLSPAELRRRRDELKGMVIAFVLVFGTTLLTVLGFMALVSPPAPTLRLQYRHASPSAVEHAHHTQTGPALVHIVGVAGAGEDQLIGRKLVVKSMTWSEDHWNMTAEWEPIESPVSATKSPEIPVRPALPATESPGADVGVGAIATETGAPVEPPARTASKPPVPVAVEAVAPNPMVRRPPAWVASDVEWVDALGAVIALDTDTDSESTKADTGVATGTGAGDANTKPPALQALKERVRAVLHRLGNATVKLSSEAYASAQRVTDFVAAHSAGAEKLAAAAKEQAAAAVHVAAATLGTVGSGAP